MAAPVYSSAGAGTSVALDTTLSVAYPATVAAGDLLLLHVMLRESGHTVTTPTGWDVLASDIDNTFSIICTLFGKIAAGTETGSLAVDVGGGAAPYGARIYKITGNQTTAGYTEGVSNSGIGDASATVTDAGVTTTGVDRLALNFVAVNGTAGLSSFTGETGGDWTEAVAEYTDATNGIQLQLQTATIASAGTINGGSFTGDGGQYIVIGIAVLPGGAAAVQSLNPSADSVDGTWTNESGNNTNLYASIDEDTASNTDYIRSVLSPSTSGCRVKLETGGDPASSTGHKIKWRVAKDATGGQTIGMTVKLYQGGGNVQGAGTLIASFTRANVSNTFTDFEETLSGGEADSITNYGDLYLEFFANAT